MVQVICLDNFFTGSKENVKHLLGKTNFETIRHDVVESILLEVDQIYHLACPASPIHYKYADFCTHACIFSIAWTLQASTILVAGTIQSRLSKQAFLAQ